ncbi:Transposase, Ptta/En/Spm, plant [Corchorus olitorius]|uniref:Transposase, Ptta/En/Spm, plant n=1 Tax=Corchorus olitorius TaxID=93759 RepID=A0A1R3J349_9ROSI|nr:Transposase, Ptta/En/Spm, plant [Corchorus olitorius]
MAPGKRSKRAANEQVPRAVREQAPRAVGEQAPRAIGEEVQPPTIGDAQTVSTRREGQPMTNHNVEESLPPNLVEISSSKSVCGPTTRQGLERMMKGKNKLVIDIPEGKGRPICEVQSAKLSSEIGVISRHFIPVPSKWTELTENNMQSALERLNNKFQMKMDDEYVKKSVLSILQKLSRNQRYKLHKHFKKFPPTEVARQNKHVDGNLTQENWDSLCDLFCDPEYQKRCEQNAKACNSVTMIHNQGSRAFVASRYRLRKEEQEPDRIEFFKATHFSEAKGWSTTAAKNAYEEMIQMLNETPEEGKEPMKVDEIMDKVLGTSPGYVKGLGYGPKPVKSSNAKVVEVNKSSKKTEMKLKKCQLKIKGMRAKMKSQMDAVRNALKEVGIMVPNIEPSESDESSESESSESSEESANSGTPPEIDSSNY